MCQNRFLLHSRAGCCWRRFAEAVRLHAGGLLHRYGVLARVVCAGAQEALFQTGSAEEEPALFCSFLEKFS